MRIEIIPCLQDNYSFLIIDQSNNSACVVDPSESQPIISFLENKNISNINNSNLFYKNLFAELGIFLIEK